MNEFKNEFRKFINMEILLQFGWAPSKSTLCPGYQRTVCILIFRGETPRNPRADTIEFQWDDVNHGNSDFVVYKWKDRNSDFVVYKWKHRDSDFVVYKWKRSKYPTLKCHISKP